MSQIIPIQEAAKEIDKSPPAIYTAKKYQRFVIKRKGAPNLFDLGAYKILQERENLIISRVQLFVEYLKHCKSVRYQDMSDKTGITVQSIASHKFAYNNAVKIAEAFSEYVKDFDSYYGWGQSV